MQNIKSDFLEMRKHTSPQMCVAQNVKVSLLLKGIVLRKI